MAASDGDDPLSRALQATAQADDRSRLQRLERSQEIGRLVATFHPITMAIEGGGMESTGLLGEAMGAYTHGLFGAALICAHATCERELAATVRARAAATPRGWERWGLGKLIQFAITQSWYCTDSIALLEDVNRKRREFYHFGDSFGPDSLFARAYAERPWRGKEFIRADMAAELQADALQAIRAAFVIRSEGEPMCQ